MESAPDPGNVGSATSSYPGPTPASAGVAQWPLTGVNWCIIVHVGWKGMTNIGKYIKRRIEKHKPQAAQAIKVHQLGFAF